MEVGEYVSGFFNVHTVLAITLFGLLTHYLYQRTKYRRPPGPWALPVIGNWTIYTSPTIHRKIAKLSETYGPVCSVALGPSRAVFLNTIDVVIEAMVKKKADFAGRPRLQSFERFSQNFKDIAFASHSKAWQFQKKVAGKALRYYMQGTRLETMLNDIFDKVFERIAEEKKPFVAADYLDKIVLHMLNNMCFGQKCDLNDPEVIRIEQVINEIIKLFGKGFFEDIFPFMGKICNTARWNEMAALVDERIVFLQKEFRKHRDTFDSEHIRDFTDGIILAHEEALKEKKTEELEILTEDHMVQILSNIFFGGMDSSRMTLDWFIACMVAYPEFQSKCQEEIEKIVGHERRPSAADRPNLCFTEACIMETMRVGTVDGLGLPHETMCDTTVGGFDIPKGTTVSINHWALHNDKNFWKDVNEFNPYRFLRNDGKLDTTPENWLPYSIGRRVCLGEPVVRIEFVLIASNLLQTFTFKPPIGVRYEIDIQYPFIGSELPADYKVMVENRHRGRFG